jgi:hypothetical protein
LKGKVDQRHATLVKSQEVDDFLLSMGRISSSPQVHLPPMFQIPESDKFKGYSDLKQHLRRYLNLAKMEGLTEEQVLYAFPLSLSDHATKWYYSLDVAKAKMWGVLIEEFFKQFSYNTMAYVTLNDLETTT